jgi:hypothetical protein
MDIRVFGAAPMMYYDCRMGLLRLLKLGIDPVHSGPSATQRIRSHRSY